MRIARSHQDIIIRLAGDHATKVRPLRDQRVIEVSLPGLTLTLTKVTVAMAIWRLWFEAAKLSGRIYSGAVAEGFEPPSATRTRTMIEMVRIPEGDTGRQIWAKIPAHSASGCGEMRIKVGELTIICDDRKAFDRQLATWALVVDLAKRSEWLRNG